MVLVKNLKIFYLSIVGKTGQNNTFHDILEGKNETRNYDFSEWDSPCFRSKI